MRYTWHFDDEVNPTERKRATSCMHAIARGATPRVLGVGGGRACSYRWALTEQTQIPLVLLFYYLHTDYDIKCASQKLNRSDIDGLWGDQTNGLKVDFGGRWRARMEVLEGSDKSKSARQVRI